MTLEELSKDEQWQADEQNEMTFEAAVIEVNRLKSQERMDIDRERRNAAIDKLIEAARFRIPRKPTIKRESFKGSQFQVGYFCPKCHKPVLIRCLYCYDCGQAIDWSWHE